VYTQAIRTGVREIINARHLNSLTAEHLRLMLCGEHTVNMRLLHTATSVGDESGVGPSGADRIAAFTRWFWRLCDKLNEQQRQELAYFWTGSTALPYTAEALQPAPSLVIRPPDDHHLPTANTCISRLYVPLYSNKHLLKLKMLQAIKTHSFGFV
jgi:E3 ubiquitin-protein ligase EDD1